MYDIPGAFVLGFLIGLTGALAPGPTLIATINAALRGGWSAGPRVTLGHIVVEAGMVVLICAGLAAVIGTYTSLIAGVGGTALVVFGLLTVRESRSASIPEGSGHDAAAHPFIAGVMTSVSNPYFWIWWFSIGSALLIGALGGGWPVAAAFLFGHWTADLGWLTLVSASIHRGRFFLGQHGYRLTLAVCGIFLMTFGGYYLSTLLP
ncbi:LysE family translocator [Methanoculleus sp. FWC-SCC1]|uniref:LysE family translocator n=1 Tax=Methanoculleus frigidifontis TaxID=2584085 RepID=A0ABT8M5X3_9EURY|nr:LysE family transporter [Methanoculleus sp. FWC-SCC1]MDN7023301.1 LysE family translocator [Methanoculleus sp. FWC-SCC1]